jgi:hypothetical protein
VSLHKKLERLEDRVKPEPSRKSPEAWREGDHDDLVLSVALACWVEERCLRQRVIMTAKPVGF